MEEALLMSSTGCCCMAYRSPLPGKWCKIYILCISRLYFKVISASARVPGMDGLEVEECEVELMD